MASTPTINTADLLRGALRHRHEADLAEVALFTDALTWAHLHPAVDDDDAATWREAPVMLAGDGAPQVTEFCVTEFAAVLGMSDYAGRALISQALELHHRLPKLWARIQAGDLVVWKARRIAEKTICLSVEAAGFVDAQVARFAHKVGIRQIDRLVDEAIARHMPEVAKENADRAADQRKVRFNHQNITFAGTSYLDAELDLADALDLDAAITHGAAQLAALGSEDHLDARRAVALGLLARGELALELAGISTGSMSGTDAPSDVELVETPQGRQRPTPKRREIVLHVHLSDQALKGGGVARLENAGGHLLTADQIRDWCGNPDAKITVKPVIDPAEHIHTLAYEIPDRLREQTVARDLTCVFPWCNKTGRSCDLDHVCPYEADGQTCSCNLAPLCRRHHRLKTFGGWTYTMLDPGQYL